MKPLADLIRPKQLSEVFGQEHILGENKILNRIVKSGRISNMIFYGPPGVGKTTVANIIAEKSGKIFYKLNATNASLKDIQEITKELDTFLGVNGVVIYLDEIQNFNKKQQQSLLEYIEDGRITLIASTTENPYFYIFRVILRIVPNSLERGNSRNVPQSLINIASPKLKKRYFFSTA